MRNRVEAAKWFLKAAEQGEAQAQYLLGWCYTNGEGVPKDDLEGYKWAVLAGAHGFDGAKQVVATLENRMSRYEIVKGQQLAEDFKPKRAVPKSDYEESTSDSQPRFSGSGFFITDDGYLVTNQHVAGAGLRLKLMTSAGMIDAKLVKMDAATDLALLKVEGKFAALPVASSRNVHLGDNVVNVGFPNIDLQGFAPKFSRGEIGSLSGPRDNPRYFQISVPVQPGNSGGALVDERGNVIGVVSAKLSGRAALMASGELPENVNYAVKSSFLLSFLESVPEITDRPKQPNNGEIKFAEVIERTKAAAVLVLVY
jgi:S1-C subfamily serine protease